MSLQSGSRSLSALAANMSIAAAGFSTHVLMPDGAVMGWGYAGEGILGYGTDTNVGDTAMSLPYTAGYVDTGTPLVSFAAGAGHLCGLTANGSVMCWGYAGEGQLGYGDTTNVGAGSDVPRTAGYVETRHELVQISAGYVAPGFGQVELCSELCSTFGMHDEPLVV
jgi:alpha-tubulin suppressor-like RCC1 family protein